MPRFASLPLAALVLLLAAPAMTQTKPSLPPGPGGTTETAPGAAEPLESGLTGDPRRDAEVLRAREFYLAEDYPAALAIVRPAAEAGHPMAQNILGDAYDRAAGVARDVQQARLWWERASAAGEMRAANNLALMFLNGRDGITPDHVEARRYFQLAGARGYGPAIAELGRMLQIGQGGAVDLPGALDHYRRAQAAGARWAFEYEAHMHRTGTGVPQDHTRARALFAQAAELGIAQSMNNLGVLLRDGMGGPTDHDAAEVQFRAAADLGYTRAALNLATLLAFYITPARLDEAHDFCTRGQETDPALAQGWMADCATIAKHRQVQ